MTFYRNEELSMFLARNMYEASEPVQAPRRLNNRSGDFRYGPVVQLENAVAEFLDQVFRVRSKHKYLGRRYQTFHSCLGLFLKVFVPLFRTSRPPAISQAG
jgi:hypothetical protein